jgi:proteasome beta subunit
LRVLDTAAEADTATGGVDRNGRIFPVVKIISARGIETIQDDKLRALFQSGRLLGAQAGGGVAQGQ